MEASAGLVAGSHNRNELVVIRRDGEPGPRQLKQQTHKLCQIFGDDVGLTPDGEPFVACNECAFPVCRDCYEYERREGTQNCPQCKTRFKRLKGCARVTGDEEEEEADDLEGEFNWRDRGDDDSQYAAESMLHNHMAYGRGGDLDGSVLTPALPAAIATASASSVSPTAAASKRPHLGRVAATGSAGIRPVPRIHHAPFLRVAQDDHSAYALALMKHPDPIGVGLAMEAVAEAAGPECIVPGQHAPLRLMGIKVWPLDIEMKFLEPFGRELHSMKKVNLILRLSFCSPVTS